MTATEDQRPRSGVSYQHRSSLGGAIRQRLVEIELEIASAHGRRRRRLRDERAALARRLDIQSELEAS